MTKYLVLCLLPIAIAGASVHSSGSELPRLAPYLVKTGLVTDSPSASPADATNSPADGASDPSKPCAGVSFTRNLRYGASELNVLDVATGDAKETTPRPVLLFVAGESFAGDGG